MKGKFSVREIDLDALKEFNSFWQSKSFDACRAEYDKKSLHDARKTVRSIFMYAFVSGAWSYAMSDLKDSFQEVNKLIEMIHESNEKNMS